MSTLIRVAEVWVPDADGYLLEFGGGLYDNAPDFGAASRKMCFGRGEGLPGRVWDEGRPILLKDLQNGYFQRAAAAKAAHLSCALAFPVFFDERLKAVVVLFCADDTGESGAIEIWRNDPQVDEDMTLVDGFYGLKDSAFEAASRRTICHRGSGLPGLAWQQWSSVFLDAVSDSDQFLRKDAATATGLHNGFAFPCHVPTNENYVLAFLAAPSLPIATCIEAWVPDVDGPILSWADGLCGPAEANGTILEAFATGCPQVSERAASEAGPGPAVIALPFAGGGAVVETLALYF